MDDQYNLILISKHVLQEMFNFYDKNISKFNSILLSYDDLVFKVYILHQKDRRWGLIFWLHKYHKY